MTNSKPGRHYGLSECACAFVCFVVRTVLFFHKFAFLTAAKQRVEVDKLLLFVVFVFVGGTLCYNCRSWRRRRNCSYFMCLKTQSLTHNYTIRLVLVRFGALESVDLLWRHRNYRYYYYYYYRQDLPEGQLCRYFVYSRADFGIFRPAGATCCTDQGQIWQRWADLRSAPLCQIWPWSVQGWGFTAPKLKKFEFYQYNCPYEAGPLHDFYKIYRVYAHP